MTDVWVVPYRRKLAGNHPPAEEVLYLRCDMFTAAEARRAPIEYYGRHNVLSVGRPEKGVTP